MRRRAVLGLLIAVLAAVGCVSSWLGAGREVVECRKLRKLWLGDRGVVQKVRSRSLFFGVSG